MFSILKHNRWEMPYVKNISNASEVIVIVHHTAKI